MKLQLLGILTVLSTSAFIGINRPVNATPSSYQQTCNNIAIAGNV